MKKMIKNIFEKLVFNILKNFEKTSNDLPFSPERMKIKIVERLITNLYDKTEYVIHIYNLKQALNHILVI